MVQNKYYDNSNNSVFSYLEFGAINMLQGKKEIWDFRLHQKAYDWLMLARYANDLVAYMDMVQMIKDNKSVNAITDLYHNEVHHQNDASLNLGKLVALLSVLDNLKGSPQDLSFFELGQTLFGCIEGMEFYQKFLKIMNINTPFLNLKKVNWFGVDISQFFNKLSIIMHEKYKIFTGDKMTLIKEKKDVFFAKGVTLLYAIRSAQDLLDILEKSRISIFDYSFSMDKMQDEAIGTGKMVRYFDFSSFYKKYTKGKNKMYIRKNKSSYSSKTNRIFVDCVYGEEKLCHTFIDLDTEIRFKLNSKLSSNFASVSLLDLAKNEKTEWIPIQNFIDSIQ